MFLLLNCPVAPCKKHSNQRFDSAIDIDVIEIETELLHEWNQDIMALSTLWAIQNFLVKTLLLTFTFSFFRATS